MFLHCHQRKGGPLHFYFSTSVGVDAANSFDVPNHHTCTFRWDQLRMHQFTSTWMSMDWFLTETETELRMPEHLYLLSASFAFCWLDLSRHWGHSSFRIFLTLWWKGFILPCKSWFPSFFFFARKILLNFNSFDNLYGEVLVILASMPDNLIINTDRQTDTRHTHTHTQTQSHTHTHTHTHTHCGFVFINLIVWI